MKTKNQLALIVLFVFGVTISSIAQDKKKYSIYLDINKNGKEVIIDTTFSSREEMEAFMEKNGFAVPPPPAIPAVPAVPGVPAVPAVPGVPSVPAVPGTKQIIIEIDDIDMSEEEKTKMNNEMRSAQKEMRKARIEMRKSEKEFAELKEEFVKMQIEIESSGPEGDKIIVRQNDEENSGDGVRKMMFIEVEEEDKGEGTMRVFKMNCDTLIKSDGEMKMIRINRRSPEAEEIVLNEITVEPVAEDIVIPETNPEEKTKSYELNVSDFKLYPNPTAGKINISFKSETSGKVQIRLLDNTGKVVIEDEVEVLQGEFSKEYSIEGKSRGTYLLQIKKGDQWKHEKVVLK